MLLPGRSDPVRFATANTHLADASKTGKRHKMTTKLSAPVWAFAVATVLGTLATPASAQTVSDVYVAPSTAFTVGPRNQDGRIAPDFRGDSRAFYYGGARGYSNPIASPHSAAGTGGGEGGDSGSGGQIEGPRQ